MFSKENINCTAIRYIRLAGKGHLKEYHLPGRLRCDIFRTNWDSTYRSIKVENEMCWFFYDLLLEQRIAKVSSQQNICSRKPLRIASRKIKLPQNFRATRYSLFGFSRHPEISAGSTDIEFEKQN